MPHEHPSVSAFPHGARASAADLAVDAAELDQAVATVRVLVGRIAWVAVARADAPEHQAAAATGHDRLALHLREFAEAATLHRSGLASQAQQLEESITVVAEAFAALERLIALGAGAPSVTQTRA